MVHLRQSSAVALLLAGWHVATSSAAGIPLNRREDASIGDFSYIKKIASIGDSYSSGVGAGSVLKGKDDEKCSRYDESYPSFLNEDARMGGADAHEFTYLGCLGDKTPEIKEQAKKLGGDMDLITISGGGNDLGFSNIVQGCIYQWAVYSKCDDALQKAEDVLGSSSLDSSVNAILDEAKSHLSSKGSIYWTGYATFFNADTSACDKIKWNLLPELNPQYLTQDFRHKVNKLVLDLNSKLKKLVTDAGATFVDYEQHSQDWFGRFCDEGVDESQVYDEKNFDRTRWNDMFYQMKWTEGDLKKRGIEMKRKRSPKSDDTMDDYQPMKGDFELVERMGIPDSISKVFHPTSMTHEFISNVIFALMTEKQAKDHGVDASLETPSIDDTESCSA
ncbi:SGNH/GDSL hydrolase family protein [Aspergillus candidus]|uniref:SGNH hydrolase n=1 Tax=Aspergillus candidus TaxID=41067 RepID=A0A2I2F157_ASPCN|nr:SGNH hydrolase [Aspergillus candidus]PLB34373.1 SGNH hydrolase [Aspergillus candidus]